MLAAALLIVISLPLLVPTAFAQDQYVVVPDWMYKSTFAMSGTSIFSRPLARDPAGKRALRTLLDYYRYMEGNMTASRAPDPAFSELETKNIPSFMLRYGWPPINNTQSVYLPLRRQAIGHQAARAERARFRTERQRFQESERLVFDALVNLGAFLDTPAATQPVKQLADWRSVFHNYRANHTTISGTHRCRIRGNLAYRIGGRWYVGLTVTNDYPAKFLADGERKYLTEYLRFDRAGRPVAQPQFLNLNVLPEYSRKYWGGRPFARNTSANPDARTRVTTSMSAFGGQAGITFFIDRPHEANIAFVAALASSGDLTRQALDSRTLSNSAILVLPLLMALLPVGLFADVGDRALLGYMVFTDFLTVLPLAVKGVELVLAGVRRYFSTRTRLWGDLRSDNTVIAGTWSCKCESAMNLSAIGGAFIALAIGALVIGIALEFVARRMVESLKEEAAVFGAAGEQDEYLWERRTMCAECECDKGAGEGERRVMGGLIGHMHSRRRLGSQNMDVEALLGVQDPATR